MFEIYVTNITAALVDFKMFSAPIAAVHPLSGGCMMRIDEALNSQTTCRHNQLGTGKMTDAFCSLGLIRELDRGDRVSHIRAKPKWGALYQSTSVKAGLKRTARASSVAKWDGAICSTSGQCAWLPVCRSVGSTARTCV